ncbi:hypothetical protein [Saccharicrinis sp. FJH54]|uniref:hypothetical protein n=1 Tax=Saccharicrinis sp. FJH54 TaxID=3344665 RepID=UPI0035D44553
MQRHKVIRTVKLITAILAWGFLCYKILTFQHWNTLSLFTLNVQQIVLLLLVILLMPLNIFLESWHWKFSVSGVTYIQFHTALKIVLGSLIPAMVTPMKIGEWPGRASFFSPELRKEVTAAATLAGIVKTVSLSLFGTLSLIIIFTSGHQFRPTTIVTGLTILFFLTLLFLWSGSLFKRILNHKFFRQSASEIRVDWLKGKFRIKSLGIAGLRTLVFYAQFALMIHIVLPDASLLQYALWIPVYFMILTFIPAFSLADPALRGSVAIVLFSGITGDAALIGIAGMMLWFINNLLPLISGTVVWFRKPSFSYQAVRKPNSY